MLEAYTSQSQNYGGEADRRISAWVCDASLASYVDLENAIVPIVFNISPNQPRKTGRYCMHGPLSVGTTRRL